jgi:hypothetical protein
MRLRGQALVVVLAFASAGGAGARQWIVDDDGPGDFRSIQAAIYAPYVVSGDSLLVRPGVYRETLYLSSKDLQIRSERGPFATILDAGGMGSVVSLLNRGPATRIEGFTLRNGSDQTGGGVWILGGAPVITRNVIEGNAAVGGSLGYGYGGGIEVYSAAPVITHNVIRDNTALDGGAGIDVYYSGPSTTGTCCPLIAQNTIVDNVVTAQGGKGGGILVFASEPWIASSILSTNAAALGGGIYVEKLHGNPDEPSVTTSIFFANQPTPADANSSWHLSPSNPQEDPRLSGGDGIALWPRSDSPALDAAEAGLPPGADLCGTPSPEDGDVDGETRGDIGAIESLGEVTGLMLGRDAVLAATVLSWNGSINPAARFNVYASDGDPFVNDVGSCLAVLAPDPSFLDTGTLPPGAIRYYLVTAEAVGEGSLGRRSDGSLRPAPACAMH